MPSAPITRPSPGSPRDPRSASCSSSASHRSATAGVRRPAAPRRATRQPQPRRARARCARPVLIIVPPPLGRAVRGRSSQEAATGRLPGRLRPLARYGPSPGARLPHPRPARGRARRPGRSASAARGSARCWRSCCSTRTASCRSTGSRTSSTARRRRSARSRRCTARSRSCGAAGAGSRARHGRRGDRDAAARLPDPRGAGRARPRRSSSGARRPRARRSRRGDAEAAVRLYRDALGLWRGEPLADLAFEPFARPVIERLRSCASAVAEQCLEAELELGRGAELVAELDELVAEHPAARAPARPADARPLPRWPAAGGARGLPRRARRARRRVRDRADARAQGAGAAHPAARPRARRRSRPRLAPAREDRRTVLLAARDGAALDGWSPSAVPRRRSAGTSCSSRRSSTTRGVARRRRRGDARAA